jgi:hypothetical protein
VLLCSPELADYGEVLSKTAATTRTGVLTPEGISEIVTSFGSGFVELIPGYRINQLIAEIIGDEQRRLFEASGTWRILKNVRCTGCETRALAVVTRETALAVPGSEINDLFHYREPVLRLRDEDQQLLLAALGGLTDTKLACKLCLTLAAVQKRWISLFERTIDSRPETLSSRG